jgi:protein-tyrosine phosphatase
VMLVAGLGGAWLAGCGGGVSPGQPDTPRLASVDNFRDIGGAGGGYPTVDGRQVRRGMFYRANVLVPGPADLAVLDTLNIATVYDLRTPGEIARTADVMPAGAAYTNINVLAMPDEVVPPPTMPGGAVAWMENAERAYVTDPAQRAGYGALLAQLAEAPGVQLIHSTAGKDRTGWVAALLLSIANVPLDVILQDYLLTNTYSAASIQTRIASIQADQGALDATLDAPLFGVQDSFLQAGFDQVQASYGTMMRYLTDGLGLSQSSVDALHDRLVI